MNDIRFYYAQIHSTVQHKEFEPIKEDVLALLKECVDEHNFAICSEKWTEHAMHLDAIITFIRNTLHELEMAKYMDENKENEIFKKKVNQVLDKLLN